MQPHSRTRSLLAGSVGAVIEPNVVRRPLKATSEVAVTVDALGQAARERRGQMSTYVNAPLSPS